MTSLRGRCFAGLVAVCLLGLPAWAAGPTVSLAVDASEAPRKVSTHVFENSCQSRNALPCITRNGFPRTRA